MLKESNILIIEDNEGDIELIKEAFLSTKAKRNLNFCTNGEEALQYLNNRLNIEKARPALILLDINLPKVDGKEVLHFIKNHESLKQIPVIILSSSALPKDIQFAYDNHANSYIVKPSNLKEFIDTVQCIVMFWLECVTYPKRN